VIVNGIITAQLCSLNLKSMRIINNTTALEFSAMTVERTPFLTRRLKGRKILLSFLRNGSCALSNYRLHQLKKYRDIFLEKGLEVICVFESMPKDIFSFTGMSKEPFYILADPMGLLYDLYAVENAEDSIRNMVASGLLTQAIKAAAQADYSWTPQEGSNFFRMPADFLIDENFIIKKAHYAATITDHLPIEKILAWLNNKPATQLYSGISPKVGMAFKHIQ
jgi:peroxiredoxin Q/BCP